MNHSFQVWTRCNEILVAGLLKYTILLKFPMAEYLINAEFEYDSVTFPTSLSPKIISLRSTP
jgi:hypothetical protein